jgi:hypothetical protein
MKVIIKDCTQSYILAKVVKDIDPNKLDVSMLITLQVRDIFILEGKTWAITLKQFDVDANILTFYVSLRR